MTRFKNAGTFCTPLPNLDRNSVFGSSTLIAAFYLLIAGCGSAIIAFAVELAVRRIGCGVWSDVRAGCNCGGC